jgi:hypothetical protein
VAPGAPRQPEIEVREVDRDQEVRPLALDRRFEIGHRASQRRIVREHLDQTDDRYLRGILDETYPGGLHLGAAHPEELGLGPPGEDGARETRPEAVPRGFPRRDHDPGCWLHGSIVRTSAAGTMPETQH